MIIYVITMNSSGSRDAERDGIYFSNNIVAMNATNNNGPEAVVLKT